jgi:hypothetical protein
MGRIMGNFLGMSGADLLVGCCKKLDGSCQLLMALIAN